MDKPKIAVISFFPLSSVSFGIISDKLMSSLSTKYSFSSLSLAYEGKSIDVNGYRVFPFRNANDTEYYFKKLQPDLVVCFNALTLLPRVVQGKYSVPSILYLPVEGYKVPSKYIEFIENFDRVLTTSKYCKDSLSRSGINSDVLYHGIDTKFFAPCLRQNKNITYGYLGINDLRKQIPTLFEAYSKVKGDKELALGVALRGDHDLASILRDMNIRAKHLEDKARGMPIEQEKIKEFYQAIDVYVGLGTEGFGLPPLEAASTGAANIAMDFGASREVLGKAAFYVKPVTYLYTELGKVGLVSCDDVSDLMQILHDDENERKRLGKYGIERAKLFPWQRSIDEFDKILQEELNASPNRKST